MAQSTFPFWRIQELAWIYAVQKMITGNNVYSVLNERLSDKIILNIFVNAVVEFLMTLKFRYARLTFL